MLYDLGRLKIINDVLAKVIFWAAHTAGAAAAVAVVCVSLAIAVRIGNWIVGW